MCPSLNFSRIHVIHSSVNSFMHTVTYCTLAAPQGQGKSHGQRKQKSFLWWAIHSSEFVCVCAPVQVCACPSLQQSIANWEQWLPLGIWEEASIFLRSVIMFLCPVYICVWTFKYHLEILKKIIKELGGYIIILLGTMTSWPKVRTESLSKCSGSLNPQN